MAEAPAEPTSDYIQRVVDPVLYPLLTDATEKRPEDISAFFRLALDCSTPKAQISVGESLPEVDIYIGHTRKLEKVKLTDLFKGKIGVLFAVVGAYTLY